MSRKIMVVAGGTGGHIFPGIATVEELKKAGWQAVWLGTPDRMEADVVPRHGIDIRFIKVKGLRGNGIKRLLSAPWMILRAIWAAKSIMQAERPDVVLAMGGYVTGPAGIAAKMLGIPLVLHEQNAVAGMTNKLLARIANKVLAAFPSAFGDKAEVVGNPVRETLSALSPKAPQSPIRVLVVGGSLGAKALNDVLPSAFAELAQQTPLYVQHQTGKGHSAAVIKAYENAGFEAHVTEFIHNMDEAMASADILVCRAGALTVSEVAAAGKMAVFVPFPHAVDDHQTANAAYLVSGGAALLMPQNELTQESLCALLAPYLAQPDMIFERATRAKALAKCDASARLAQHCQQAVK